MRLTQGEQLGLVELNAELLAEAMRKYPHCVVGDVADLIGAILHCRCLFPASLVRQLLALIDSAEGALIRHGVHTGEATVCGCW